MREQNDKIMSNDKITYAKYELKNAINDTLILKDGHTMFDRDVVTDLNRKSYLEEQLTELKQRHDEAMKVIEAFSDEYDKMENNNYTRVDEMATELLNKTKRYDRATTN